MDKKLTFNNKPKQTEKKGDQKKKFNSRGYKKFDSLPGGRGGTSSSFIVSPSLIGWSAFLKTRYLLINCKVEIRMLI